MNILQAIDDPNLFKPWFKNESWAGWRAWLAALFGLPMTAAELALFVECTGRSVAPTTPAREGWLVCGRRAGKSFILALIAVYLATFRDYSKHLAPGERGTVLILSADRKQSRVIFRYISALLKQVKMLAPLVENERAEFLRPHQSHHDRGRHGVISYELVATHLSLVFATSWPSGAAKTVPHPTMKSSALSVPAWRLSRMRCCSADRHPMRGVARSTTLTRSITAKMVRCWSGKLLRAP